MHGQVISNVQATTFLKKFKNFCIKKMKLEFKGTKKINKGFVLLKHEKQELKKKNTIIII